MTPRGRRALVALSTALAVGGLLALADRTPLYFNLTPSLPRGLYLKTREAPARRSLAAVCLAPSRARIGLRRGYLRKGTCPGGSKPILKLLVGAEGDRVRVDSDRVSVNGHSLPVSAPRDRDSAGRSLRPYPCPVRLAPDEWWLHAPTADSWDSRYYGPVPGSSIRAVVRPLATWGGGPR